MVRYLSLRGYFFVKRVMNPHIKCSQWFLGVMSSGERTI